MRRAILLTLAAVATGGLVAGSLFSSLDGADRFWPITWIGWAPVGAFILVRKQGNRVGAACLTIGTTMSLAFWADVALEQGVGDPAWVEMLSGMFGVIPWITIISIALVFPTGSLATVGDRVAAVTLAGIGSLAVASFALTAEPLERTQLQSPLAFESLAPITEWVVGDTGFLLVILQLLASLVLLALRWRRSSGIERLQFRWFFLGVLFFTTILTLGQVVQQDTVADYLWFIAGLAIPTSIGFAILRYRLYEIDRVISRSLSYTLVVGLLGLVFAAGALWVPQTLGVENPLFVAGSTLAVAALFNPVRKRVQAAVDRRFNRSRYDAERVMDGFAGSLRDRMDGDEVVAGWVGVVSETMQPASAGVWVKE